MATQTWYIRTDSMTGETESHHVEADSLWITADGSLIFYTNGSISSAFGAGFWSYVDHAEDAEEKTSSKVLTLAPREPKN